MSDATIKIANLAKRFGKNAVLQSVSLAVPPGQTFAFLGRNGAGKTTTIRMMLGLLRPDAGKLEVLGLDPAKHALEIRRRIGYLAEDQQMWGWMRVKQLLSFMGPFYPNWDKQLARQYVERFELPTKTRVKHLSKGQSVRLGLLLALAHRPELVILDDPTLGLDPIMRKEFIRDVIDHLQSRGATVFFSSHLLYEVEAVADSVAILDRGRIVRHADTDTLRQDVKQLILPAAASEQWTKLVRALPDVKVLDTRNTGKQIAIVVENAAEALNAARQEGLSPKVVDLNLDEIFEAYVIGKRDGQQQGNPEPDLERVA